MALTEADLRAYAANRNDNLRFLRKRAGEYVAAFDAYLSALSAGSYAQKDADALEQARRSLEAASKLEKNNEEHVLSLTRRKR
jgi:hypothetical protein